ncbi:GNAT family N-acetyltransferase [Saccharomonospora xinjiangensis]|uniref:Acetyltransferase n=1 Tax=Saccharomonospora xinjiangensis XJ-54 TaxID=882086 RepID=I0UZQ8_9PSEU|nr:GNAT family N-acetyltransferase [Saccharomonospora xinjiangensis]EID53361.1 acetyltransferase [Saccharomonospora xinjiangensis XJ-54]QBQ59330.1 putative acetyltransferase [Saccharomonospora xinjiangensis]
MTDIVVRVARPEEITEVGEMTVAAYRVNGYLDDPDGQVYTRSLRDAARRAEHAHLLVAVDGADELVGTATVAEAGSALAEMCGEGEAELRMVAVPEHARGRGVGEALTRAAMELAADRGAKRMVLCSLDTMTAAHRLYERLGFERVPSRDWHTPSGLPLVAFTKEL